MTNPDNAASQDVKDAIKDEASEIDAILQADEPLQKGNTESKAQTTESKVAELLGSSNHDSEGNIKFPDDTSDEVKFAVNSEKRRRDTQAEFTKSKQAQAALEAEKTELLKQVHGNVKPELSHEQVAELDELKFSDPDLWHNKLRTYESEAQAKHTMEVQKRLKEVSAEGAKTAGLELRKKALEEFQITNPDFKLTDDILKNDIPPRITNRLQNNEVSFDQFLQEANDYLKKGKVVATVESILGQPNLSKVAGNDLPLDSAVDKESKKAYENEIY